MPHDSQNVPRLIIWDGSVVTVDREDGQVRVPWALAKASGGDNGTAFGEVFREVKTNRATHYFFVAVRPSGFGNYTTTLEELIGTAKLRYGDWPIAQNKSILLRFGGSQKGGSQ